MGVNIILKYITRVKSTVRLLIHRGFSSVHKNVVQFVVQMKTFLSYLVLNYCCLFPFTEIAIFFAMAEGFCFDMKSILGKLFKAVKSLTGLIIILVLYNIIGAVIFVHLEAPYEREEAEESRRELQSKHKNLIRVLTNITYSLNSTEFETLRNDTEVLISEYKAENNKTHTETSWDFWKAMFYCGTIYTTIGMYNIYYISLMYLPVVYTPTIQ